MPAQTEIVNLKCGCDVVLGDDLQSLLEDCLPIEVLFFLVSFAMECLNKNPHFRKVAIIKRKYLEMAPNIFGCQGRANQGGEKSVAHHDCVLARSQLSKLKLFPAI